MKQMDVVQKLFLHGECTILCEDCASQSDKEITDHDDVFDEPMHCDKCGNMFDVNLSEDGVNYVIEALVDSGNGLSKCVKLWLKEYSDDIKRQMGDTNINDIFGYDIKKICGFDLITNNADIQTVQNAEREGNIFHVLDCKTSWFSDDFENETVTGKVYFSGDGFFAICEWDNCDIIAVNDKVFDCPLEAANLADCMANRIAEVHRENDHFYMCGQRLASQLSDAHNDTRKSIKMTRYFNDAQCAIREIEKSLRNYGYEETIDSVLGPVKFIADNYKKDADDLFQKSRRDASYVWGRIRSEKPDFNPSYSDADYVGNFKSGWADGIDVSR